MEVYARIRQAVQVETETKIGPFARQWLGRAACHWTDSPGIPCLEPPHEPRNRHYQLAFHAPTRRWQVRLSITPFHTVEELDYVHL